MEWIIFLMILGLAIAFFPQLLRAAKSSSRKGTTGGMIIAIGMAFTVLLDPAKKTAIENIDKRKDIGNADADAAGDPENGHHPSNTMDHL